jgi:hypothetical protein
MKINPRLKKLIANTPPTHFKAVTILGEENREAGLDFVR